MQATRQAGSDGRWHFQHGPIDMVLQAEGTSQACEHAIESAWRRFQSVLAELVSELPMLRLPVAQLQAHSFKGVVAQRMWQASSRLAWAASEGFVTPMAAVAGAVAQEIVQGAGSTSLLVPSAKNHARDARRQDCSSTHHARLEGDDEREVFETPRARGRGRGSNGLYFCVTGGISGGLPGVVSARDHFARRAYQDCPNRHVAGGLRLTREIEGAEHPRFILG